MTLQLGQNYENWLKTKQNNKINGRGRGGGGEEASFNSIYRSKFEKS